MAYMRCSSTTNPFDGCHCSNDSAFFRYKPEMYTFAYLFMLWQSLLIFRQANYIRSYKQSTTWYIT